VARLSAMPAHAGQAGKDENEAPLAASEERQE